jgi:hypothetical protein
MLFKSTAIGRSATSPLFSTLQKPYNIIIPVLSMGNIALRTIFISILQKLVIPSALIERIERAKAKQAIDPSKLMTRIIFTFKIAKILIAVHFRM